jgi:hypothetical protein
VWVVLFAHLLCGRKSKVDKLNAEKKESERRTALMDEISSQNKDMQKMLQAHTGQQPQPVTAFSVVCLFWFLVLVVSLRGSSNPIHTDAQGQNHSEVFLYASLLICTICGRFACQEGARRSRRSPLSVAVVQC